MSLQPMSPLRSSTGGSAGRSDTSSDGGSSSDDSPSVSGSVTPLSSPPSHSSARHTPDSLLGSLSRSDDGADDEMVDPAEATALELAQARDRQARREARRGEKEGGKPAAGGRMPISVVVPHAEWRTRRPKLIPGASFTGEEMWQLRRAFDMFAAKYRRSDRCSLRRRDDARTEEEKMCLQRFPNQPQARTSQFTLQAFETAAAAQKGVPLLADQDASGGTEGHTSTSAAVDMPSEEEDQDLIRMQDYAACFAAWTGLTSCQSTLNLHLYWTCSQTQRESAHPCITFAQFVRGFGDYTFAAEVSREVCVDPAVRRKRLFRSLTAEVFESLKHDAVSRARFDPKLAALEFACFMCPPLFWLRGSWTPHPILVMPPFTTRARYLTCLALSWFFSVLWPLMLPHFDSTYEEYTKSSKLCEVETYGLLALYAFLALYWSVLVGSQYSESQWEVQLKRDLDWLSLCRVNSPLGCVHRIRSAKDIFEAIFSQVYLESPSAPNAAVTSSNENGGRERTRSIWDGHVSPARRHRGFRGSELSKFRFTRCLWYMLLSFLMSFPIAFLPTLYRASVAHVDLVPTGHAVAILIVINYMLSSIFVTLMLVNLNFHAFQKFRDFAATLKQFNNLFLLTRGHARTEQVDTPYIPLHNPLNVRSWAMMRRYLLEIHMESKVRLLENVYGVLFLATVAGIVFVVVREVMSHFSYASSLLVMYVSLLFAAQLMCMVFVGVRINELQSAHVSLLCDQSWDVTRVLLSYSAKCDGEEKIRLQKTEHLLSQLAQTVRHSRTVLCIWSIPLEANFRNAIITVVFSICSSAISYWLRNSN